MTVISDVHFAIQLGNLRMLRKTRKEVLKVGLVPMETTQTENKKGRIRWLVKVGERKSLHYWNLIVFNHFH